MIKEALKNNNLSLQFFKNFKIDKFLLNETLKEEPYLYLYLN